jgi:colicin import membrane protein
LFSLKDEFRKPGMPFSLGLHAAVLVASIVTFSSPKKFEDVSEAVSVEVIDENALREMMKGEKTAKPAPTPRVDRIDPKPEQNAPGEVKRQVNTENAAKPQEETAKEERKETTAAVVPPPPLPRVQPPPPKPPEPPKVVTPAAKPPQPAEKTEEEEAEEAIRQAQRKKAEEQKKLEEARRAEERRKTEEARRQEQQKQEREKLQQMAEQEQAKAEQQKREQEDARKREEQRKVAEAKAAEDRKKAEDAKKAQEAAKKAAEEKRKREAEQDARNQATADAARRALLASREVPQNSGNTGQQVQRAPAQGAPAATGQRMNPSDRAALAGLLADQIRACWSVPVSGKPNVLPQVRVALNADGSLGGTPVLINSSSDPNFRALADSGMRAIRQCSPFRIPQRFAPTYDDWRSIAVQLNPDD